MAYITHIAHTLPALQHRWLAEAAGAALVLCFLVTSPRLEVSSSSSRKSDDSQCYLPQMDLIGGFVSLLMYLEFLGEAAGLLHLHMSTLDFLILIHYLVQFPISPMWSQPTLKVYFLKDRRKIPC